MTNKYSRLVVRMMALGTLLLGISAVTAGEKITLMVSSIEKQIYLPAKLAEQLGYLKETGLDIELLSVPAGANAEKEMLLGSAQGVIGFYDHTIHLQARGKLVQSVQRGPGRGVSGFKIFIKKHPVSGRLQREKAWHYRTRLINPFSDPVSGCKSRCQKQ